MRDDKKIFLLGERRRVSLYLWLESGLAWTPETPTWTLLAPDGTTAGSGTAEAAETAEDPILTIDKAQGMTLTEIQTVTLERMYEGS